ncbi:hypothetical protein ABKY54_004542 [Vibrio harveyi]
MSNLTLIQPSMSAGELSPEMFGRVDTEHYKIGLELARNLFVDYHGGVSNRPGTYHVASYNEPVFHIEFERSATVTYMLEFGDNVMRILKNGHYILNAIGSAPLEYQTPYKAAEMPFVRHIQSVDVLTLFHSDHPMYQVKHITEDFWKVEEFKIKGGPYESVNIDKKKNMWTNGQKGTIRLFADFDVFTQDSVGRHVRLEATGSFFTKSWMQRMVAKTGDIVYYAGNYYECTDARPNSLTGDTPPTHTEGERWDGPDQDIPNDNDSHFIGIKWRYSNSGFGEIKITKFISSKEVEGEVTIELPKDVTQTGAVATMEWNWKQQTYKERFTLSTPTPDTYNQPSFELMLKVFIASTPTVSKWVPVPRQNNWYVIDLWGTPTLFISPQTNWDKGSANLADLKLTRSGTPSVNQTTYKWAFNSITKKNGYPKCGTYYSDRLTIGGNKKNAQTIWMSRTDSFNDFGTSSPILAEDALTLNVAGVKLCEIEHLLPLNALIAFTSGGVWAVSPTEAKKVSAEEPPSIDIQSYNGASYIPPLISGGDGIYVQQNRRIIRELQYDFGRNRFVDINLCVRSSHIFKNRRITSWAFAKEPYNLVWCILDDGTAATLTYMKEQQVWGWTTHETDGKYISVASVSEDEKDAVYFVVERENETGKYYSVEYQANRNFSEINAAHFLDSGVAIDSTGPGWVELTGGTKWEYPEKVHIDTDRKIFTPSSVGKKLVIRNDEEVYFIKILSVTIAGEATGRLEQVLPEEFRDKKLFTCWGIGTEEIQDLQHLEGKTVKTVIDGMVGDDHVVKNGKVTLSRTGLVVHVGLPYKSIGRTLAVEVSGQGTPTTQHLPKAVNRVGMKLYDTYGGKAGSNLDNMYEAKQRKYEDYNSPVESKTGIVEIDTSSNYDSDGQFYFMQDEPMPFTVLSLMPEVDFGG